MSQLPKFLQRRPDRAALVIAAVLAGIGALLLNEAGRLSGVGGGYAGIGPDGAPRVIGWALIALAVWTVFDAFAHRFPMRAAQAPGPILWIVGGLVLQLVLLGIAGFSIATGIMFAFTARAFGKRNLLVTVPVGIVLAFLLWLLFARVLMLSLPAGFLEHIFFPGVK